MLAGELGDVAGILLDAGGVPWNSRNSVGASGWSSWACSLTARIIAASSSSHRAIGTPACTVAIAVATAASTLGSEHTADDTASGMGRRRRVSSVIMPSVPSEPMNRCVKSKPAEDLRARVPVWMTRPSASTTSRSRTFSRIVP